MPMNLAECPGLDCALSYPTLPTTYQPNYFPTVLAGLGCGAGCACQSCSGTPSPYPVALSGLGAYGFDACSARTVLIGALSGAVVAGKGKRWIGAINGGIIGVMVELGSSIVAMWSNHFATKPVEYLEKNWR